MTVCRVKIGLETLLLRWEAEYDRWGQYTTLCGARIGWVRGTGLMHGLDRVYRPSKMNWAFKYGPEQMASMLLDHCTTDARLAASRSRRRSPI